MAIGVLWYAQQAKLAIAANLTTSVVTNVPLYGQLVTPTDWTGRVTNLTIRGGGRDVVAVNTLGIGQLQHKQRPEIVTAEFTLVYDNVNSSAYVAGTSSTYSYTGSAANTGTYVRYQFGEKTTAALDRTLAALVFTLDNADTGANNKTVYVAMVNAVFTNPPELSLDADGYLNEKWTVKCLAQDYYDEANFTSL